MILIITCSAILYLASMYGSFRFGKTKSKIIKPLQKECSYCNLFIPFDYKKSTHIDHDCQTIKMRELKEKAKK